MRQWIVQNWAGVVFVGGWLWWCISFHRMADHLRTIARWCKEDLNGPDR